MYKVEEVKQKFTDDEEAAMKKLILDQDIDFYHEYMQNVKSQFNESEPKEQADLMNIYNAAENICVALLILKKVIEISGKNHE